MLMALLLHLCCNDDTVSQHLAKRMVRSVMMMTPSGMADSGDGSVETVVLTDPPGSAATLDRLTDRLKWR